METPKVATIPTITQPSIRPVAVTIPTIANANYLRYEREQREKRALFFDYNNPDQVNSYADVIGRTAKKLIEENKLPIIGNIIDATGQFISDTASLNYNSFIKPLIYGGSDADKMILFNNANNLFETLDILANPVKGMVMDGPQGAYDAFFNRVNYDYNTGNLAKDIALEVVSDPITLLSLGASSLGKAALKIGSQGMEALSKEVGEKAAKRLTSKFYDNFAGNTADTINQLRRHTDLTPKVEELLHEITVNKTAMNVIKATKRIGGAANMADSVITKGAFYSSFGMPAFIAKTGVIDPIRNMTVRQMQHSLTAITGNPKTPLTLVKFFDNQDAIIRLASTLSAADNNLTNFPAHVRRDFATTLVNREHRSLTELLSYKTSDMLDETFRKALDAKVSELTDGQLVYFPDYVERITRLAESNTDIPILGLYVDELAKYKHYYDRIELFPIAENMIADATLIKMKYDTFEKEVLAQAAVTKIDGRTYLSKVRQRSLLNESSATVSEYLKTLKRKASIVNDPAFDALIDAFPKTLKESATKNAKLYDKAVKALEDVRHDIAKRLDIFSEDLNLLDGALFNRIEKSVPSTDSFTKGLFAKMRTLEAKVYNASKAWQTIITNHSDALYGWEQALKAYVPPEYVYIRNQDTSIISKKINQFLDELEEYFNKLYASMPDKVYTMLDGTVLGDSTDNLIKTNMNAIKKALRTLASGNANLEEYSILDVVREELNATVEMSYHYLVERMNSVTNHLDFADMAEGLHEYIAASKHAADLLDTTLTRTLSTRTEILSELLNTNLDKANELYVTVNTLVETIEHLDLTLYDYPAQQIIQAVQQLCYNYKQVVQPMFHSVPDLDDMYSEINTIHARISGLLNTLPTFKDAQLSSVPSQATNPGRLTEKDFDKMLNKLEDRRRMLERSKLKDTDPYKYDARLAGINQRIETINNTRARYNAHDTNHRYQQETRVTVDLMNTLHDQLDKVKEFYHIDIMRTLPQFDEAGNPVVEYTQKLLTLGSYHRLLDNEDAIALMNSIENKTEFYNSFLVLEGLGSNAAFKLRATLEGMGNYLKFTHMLSQSRLPKEMQAKLLDTMQNYSWLDKYGLAGVYEVGEHNGRVNHLRSIVEDTADAMLANSSKRNYKLENFSQVIKQRHPEWFTRFQGSNLEHTAMYDAYATAMLDRELGLFEHKGLQTRRYYADIETTGFNAHQGSLLQLGVYDAETDELYNFIVGKVSKDTVPPTQQVLDLLYDGDVEVYNAIHHRADVDVANARFGTASINIMCDSEADALNKFQQILKRDRSMLVDNVLTFHNGNEFDVDFINTRLKVNGLPLIAARKIEDTLEAWRAKEGIEYMSRAQKAEAERLLKEYVNLREMEQVSQDSLMRALDQGGVHLLEFSSTGDRGRFIPKFDREFTDSLSEVVDVLLEQNDKISVQLAGHLANIRTSLINTLKSVKESNYRYSRHRIYKHDLAKAFDEVNPNMFAEIEDAVMKANSNIMLYFNGEGGVLNPLNPKVTYDAAALKRWYVLDWDAIYKDSLVQYLTQLGRRLNRVVDSIDLTAPILERTSIEKLRAMRSAYLVLHNQIAPSEVLVQLNQLFKTSDNIVEEFAMTQAVYNHLVRTITNNADLSKEYAERVISKNPNDIRYLFAHPESLRTSTQRAAETTQKYWQLNLTEDAVNRYIMNQYKQVASIDELRKIATKKAELGIATPKSETQAVLHQQIYDLFMRVEKGAEGLEDKELGRYYGLYKQAFDSLDDTQTYNNIREFLSLSPEHMLSRLYHQSSGLVTFKLTDIMANKYAQDAATSTLVRMYRDLLNDDGAYRALGIDIFEYDERVWITLKPEAMDTNIKYVPIREDHAINYNALIPVLDDEKDQTLASGIKDILTQYAKIRSTLGARMDDVGYSTLENLDEYAMRTIYDRIPKEVLDRLPSLDTLRAHGAFVGSKFNHSILGSAPSRHELMPYSSYNPAKNLHAAIDLVQSRLDETVKYEAYIDAATHKLSGELYRNIPDEELVKYFKESNGAMRLAFKAPSKRDGQAFEIKSIHVKSTADLEFARRVGAVVMTEHMYTKSVSILNRNGLRNPFLKAFEKAIVTPSKIGMLAFKEGFILRNLLDSTIKNMVDTGDPIGILRHTLDTAKLYFDYKQANLDMIALAKKMHLSLKEVIPIYFESPRAIDKEMYELVHRFKIDGYSGGMTSELRNYYGEATDKLHRLSGIERWGIDKAQFEKYMHTPLEVALEQLAAKFPGDEYLLSQFRSVYHNYHTYKRAYEMLKHTRNQEFNLENLVEYLYTPDKVPAHLVPEFDELVSKTANVQDKEVLMDQFMELSPVKAFFDINVGLEEIFRLTNYTYHMRYNLLPEHEALSHTLKTHFDYAHKAQWQYYTELLFPFSTFKLNNFMFWWEQFNNNPMALKMLEDVMGEVMALDEHGHDDITSNRSLQYHILAGNLVLKDSEANIVVKISPSVMDTLTMLVDPKGAAASSLVAPLKVAYELSTNKRQSYEDENEYGQRVANTVISSIPLVGPVYTGVQGAQKLYTATGGAPYSMFSSTLGVVKYPKRKAPNLRRTYGKKLYSSYTRPGAHRNLLKRYRYYHALTNRTLFATGYYSRRHNIQIMTRKGGAIARYLSMPTNKYTNNMKVALLRTRF